MTDSIGRRTRRGVVWAFGAQGAMRGLATARTVILANFLSPGEFGLFGVAMLALSALEQLSGFGLNVALIRKQEISDVDVDTAWTVQLVRSAVIALLLFFGAPWMAVFFAEPQVTNLLRVIAAAQFVSGWKNIGLVLLQKELQFRQRALFDVAGEAAALAVALVLVFALRNVWALVWGYAGGVLASVLLSYTMHPHRPRFCLDRAAWRSMFHIGKHTYFQSVLAFLLTDGDDWFTGRVLGAAALGLYQMAYRLSNLVATEVVAVISKVTLPAYAKMQSNRSVLLRSFTRVFSVIAFTVVPLSLAMMAFARDGVLLLLGERWLPMVPVLQVLALFGMVRALGASFGPIYVTLDRVDIPTRLTLLILAVMALAIYPLSQRFGVVGVALTVTGALLIGQILGFFQFVRLTGLPPFRILGPVVGALLISGLVAVEVRLLGTLAGLHLDSLLTRLVLTVSVAALLFAAHVWALAHWAGINLRVLVFGSEAHQA